MTTNEAFGYQSVDQSTRLVPELSPDQLPIQEHIPITDDEQAEVDVHVAAQRLELEK